MFSDYSQIFAGKFNDKIISLSKSNIMVMKGVIKTRSKLRGVPTFFHKKQK